MGEQHLGKVKFNPLSGHAFPIDSMEILINDGKETANCLMGDQIY